MSVRPDRIVIVSSDCHAGIPHAAYRPYLDSRYHDDFDDYGASRTAWWEQSTPFVEEVLEDREALASQVFFADSKGRLRDLEDNGVVAEVLFPGASPATSVPWSDFLSSGAFRARTPRQRELQTAGERAYNRWLAEFCNDTPNRRAGLAFVALHDVGQAVRDVEWAASHDLRGVLMPTFNYDLPEYCHAWYWDPIWKALEEARLVLSFHGGYGLPEYGVHQTLPSLEAMFFVRRATWHLMLSGVFDRFPGLQMAITESSAMWVPSTMAELDAVWERERAASSHRPVLFRDNGLCRRRPSEYWQDNCHVGASLLSRPEMESRAEIGVNTMMFGNDYPHPEGSWGKQTSWLQASLGQAGGSEEEARQILGLNAARLYQFDVDALQPIANRVGPAVEDILHDLADDDVQKLLSQARDGGRTLAAGYLVGAKKMSQ